MKGAKVCCYKSWPFLESLCSRCIVSQDQCSQGVIAHHLHVYGQLKQVHMATCPMHRLDVDVAGGWGQAACFTPHHLFPGTDLLIQPVFVFRTNTGYLTHCFLLRFYFCFKETKAALWCSNIPSQPVLPRRWLDSSGWN